MAHPSQPRHPGHSAVAGSPAATTRAASSPSTAADTAARKADLPSASCSDATLCRTAHTGMRTVEAE